MKLYRFSPIENTETLAETVEYVAKHATQLYFRSTGLMKDDLVTSLTIFAHYPEEFEALKSMASTVGSLYNENNGPRYKLHQPIEVNLGILEINGEDKSFRTAIQLLRIRQPDPYRMQVGCADLDVDFQYKGSKDAASSLDKDRSPRLITRKDFYMLEFFDPNIDVLAYVLSGNR